MRRSTRLTIMAAAVATAAVLVGVPGAAVADRLPHPSVDPVVVSSTALGADPAQDAVASAESPADDFPFPVDGAPLPPLRLASDPVAAEVSGAATAGAAQAGSSGLTAERAPAAIAPGSVQAHQDAPIPMADVTVTVSTDGTPWVDPGQITVYAVRPQDAYRAELGTHTALGDFSASLPAADYQFWTYYDGPANLISPDPVRLTMEADHSYHLDLVYTRGGTISGRLATTHGTTVAEPRITLGRLYDGEPLWTPAPVVFAPDGSFTVSQLYSGDYQVFFDSAAAVPAVRGEYWNDTRSQSDATIVHVDGGADVTAISAVLDDVNALRGVVRTKDSRGRLVPAADVEIHAVGYSGPGWRTDSQGAFDAYGFADGTYSFQFGATPGGAKWGTVVTDPITFSGGTTVIDGYDIEVAIGGTITGAVSWQDREGEPSTPGSSIVVQASRLNPDSGLFQPVAAASANPTYRLQNLAPGQYRLYFVDQADRDVRDEYFNNTPYKSEATLVTVTSGGITTGIDAQLDPWLVWLWQYGGADRYEVAKNISVDAFAPGVPVLYIASGEKYPDALSAGPAAARENGALLLVARTVIPQSTRDGIAALRPEKIVVVGGTASISDAVYDQLAQLQPDITRISGADRYEVSRNVIDYAFCGGAAGACTAGARTVIAATGSNFPDALSAGPAAAHLDGAVLLLAGGDADLDQPTRDLLARLGTTEVYIAGGPASVGYPVERALTALLPGAVTRLSGADRFEASAAINSAIFGSGETAFVASGTVFADALSGGPSAATLDAPLYLVQKDCWPESVWTQITRHFEPVDLILLGGPNTIGTGVSNVERLCG